MASGLGDLRGWQTWRLCCELTVPPAPQGLASVFSNRTSRKSASRTDSDNMADGEGYRNPTEVQMSQLVLPCHTNQRGELSVGQLLKWIDATACLSGEAEPGMAAFPALATHTRGEALPERRPLLIPTFTQAAPPACDALFKFHMLSLGPPSCLQTPRALSAGPGP